MSSESSTEGLFERLKLALGDVHAQAQARENQLAELAVQASEAWAAWGSKWKEQAARLEQQLQELRQCRQRAERMAQDANVELEKSQAAIGEWLKMAQRLIQGE